MNQKTAFNICMGKNNNTRTTGYPYAEEWSLDPHLTPWRKMNSKSIKDLNMKSKCLKEKIGINLHNPGLGSGPLDMIPKTQPTNEKVELSI